jgi:hypothetical protein
MSEKSDSQSSSSSLRAIAQGFRLIGWISFWTQIVLGVVSGVILLFAVIFQRSGPQGNNLGTGFGAFLAISGLVALGIGIYLAFRYTRIARQLESPNPNNRPRKLETIQVLRLALIVHLVGMGLTIFGAQAIAGTLLTKSLTLPQIGTGGVYTQVDPSRIIQSLDIFVVQANTNTVSAHFAGLLSSLWLLNRVSRP